MRGKGEKREDGMKKSCEEEFKKARLKIPYSRDCANSGIDFDQSGRRAERGEGKGKGNEREENPFQPIYQQSRRISPPSTPFPLFLLQLLTQSRFSMANTTFTPKEVQVNVWVGRLGEEVFVGSEGRGVYDTTCFDLKKVLV